MIKPLQGAGWLSLTCVLQFILAGQAGAANPVVIGKGMCDPSVRVYGDTVYAYCTHDVSPQNKYFTMTNWWVWSSTNLVDWQLMSTIQPENTYYKRSSTACWATDGISRSSRYFFYFTLALKKGNEIGVMSSTSPAGPWTDPRGTALIPAGMLPSPSQARDPVIFQDQDGTGYIICGRWDYYIAKLNPDMISLAEKPKLILLDKKDGPYGPGKTDDKPFLHEYAGNYYLSWGCFYAMSTNLYGPYTYKGCFIATNQTTPQFLSPSWSYFVSDRHGCFFPFHHQWYFMCNDKTYPGTQPYFRDSIISYVHYRTNGEIAPIYISEDGAGQYDADKQIEAENYFDAVNVTQHENATGFEVHDIRDGSSLVYPNVSNLKAHSALEFHAASGNLLGAMVEVHGKTATNDLLLARCSIPYTGSWTNYTSVNCPLNNPAGKMDIYFVFHGDAGELLRLDWFKFEKGHFPF
jgi:arabinoxylan arabinofuranohydrolase